MPSRPFNQYMGKNTFGVLKEPQDAGQYILNKTASTSFCAPNVCVPSRTITSQSSRLILRRANKIYFSRCQDPYNTANLNINLVTKLNLRDVSVIQQNDPYAVPTYLDVTSIPYLDYTIDPSGSLFGNTICGTNNFQNYLRPNIQLPFYIINGNYETTSSDTYNTIITFYSDSTIRFFKSISVNYVVVGGGGGGRSGQVGSLGGGGGSGGGGGGVIENSSSFIGSYTITVGAGGTGASSSTPGTSGENGANSSIIGNSTSIIVIGGQGGQDNTGGTSGTAGSIGGTWSIPAYLGGGGAGSGYTSVNKYNGSVNISTTNYGTTFGAGGGGGGDYGGGTGGNTNAGTGGYTGYIPAENGVANTGGGGGGGGGAYTAIYNAGGGNGGSGVVILLFNL